MKLGIAGHIAIDRIITQKGTRLQLGGPPTYAALIAKVLGFDLKVATHIGQDLSQIFIDELAELGVEFSEHVVESPTTRFVLDYTHPERRMAVDSICDPLTPEDLYDLPEAVIMAPIVGEMSINSM